VTFEWHTVAGFGVAGNFAEHLAQAGESVDFVDVAVDEAHAPKGLFPFYLPHHSSFLGTFPLHSHLLVAPKGESLQMEPEVAIVCDVYYENGKLIDIEPIAFGPYNDASIRRAGAPKISHKKNWGAATKGVGEHFLAIDRFAAGGVMDGYRIASFVRREGKLIAYGEDSALLGYSYFYQKLLDWMVGKFQTQTDNGPLEAIGEYLKTCGLPKRLLISIGATRYTEFGEHHYLEVGDKIYVVLYRASSCSHEMIVDAILHDKPLHESTLILAQEVVDAL